MSESTNSKSGRLAQIYSKLARRYPNAGLRLNFRTPLDLLVASILAAQCRDERVNEVTSFLFGKYKTAADYANADVATFEREIGSVPIFRRKTRSIKAACESLVAKHGGEAPADIDALTALKGVGRKTANLVLSCAFGKPAIVVDTHVLRIAGRLGLSKETDRDKIERDLMRLLPKNRWSQLAHLFSAFGRDVCKARAPKCEACPVGQLCPSVQRGAG